MLNARQWLVAIGASLLVHGVLFVAWPSLEGAQGPGEQGVEIGLGLLGDVPEEPVNEVEPLAEETELPEPEPEPEPAPPPEPVPEPEPEPPPEPPVVPEPEPVRLPVLAQVPEPSGPTVAAPRVRAAERPTSRPDASRRSNPQVGQSAGAASRAVGGKVGLRRSYAGVLAAHLNRHKTYPVSARRQGREGTVTLRLVVDRRGRALSARIARNAAFPELDQAALSMLERAQPLPPFPGGMSETELVVMIPVTFELDRSD